jgi:hypothetical protein
MASQRRRARRGAVNARKSANRTHADCLQQAIAWFSRSNSFTNLTLHGNVGWKAAHLIGLVVLWVWSDQRRLTGAFAQAHALAQTILGKPAVDSYQGMMGALRSYSQQLLPALSSQLHRLMEQSAGEHWRIGRWLALAVDGSRISTPRSKSNERVFAAKNYGFGGRARYRSKWKNKQRRSKPLGEPMKPQIWLTLIWHMGLKMPWCWKTGPSSASERHHLRDMLQAGSFPKNTLFCCDAGFTGYEFWEAILEADHSFLIRVGGNVRLLRGLGLLKQRHGLVYLWPSAAMRKGQAPLVLRLLEFQGPRGKIYLVTNLLSHSDLSPKQAQELYRLRWGVELQFRALKQTFGRGKLRSRTADNALVELNWSIVGLWIIQLYAVKEQIKFDHPPGQSSVAMALDIMQHALRNWSNPVPAGKTCRRQLGQAIQDTYQRQHPKKGRYLRKYKHKPSATKPTLVKATRIQTQAYQALKRTA